MKVLLSSLPHLGHVVPMNVLKHALEYRGHEVVWDIPEYDTKFSGPLSDHLARFQNLADRYTPILLKRVLQEAPDLLVTDPTIFSVEEIANKSGIPWALFSNLPLFYPFGPVPLVIQGSIPSFEQIEKPNLMYSGPILPTKLLDVEYPEIFEELKTSQKPVIYVTQGTVATNQEDLITVCRKACGNQFFLVDKFMQYAYFMPFVDIFITNGGYGGVQAALYHAVPMIIAGETEDKPIVAEKAAAAGIAINLKTKKPSPGQVYNAIKEILASDFIQRRSRQLAREARTYKLLPAIYQLEALAGFSSDRAAHA